jgi:antitoxin component YwqK of YwqJK toxin-antitoxin module
MSIVDDAYAALLAGLTTKKNGKEIWWNDKDGNKITVELVDSQTEKWIERYHYPCGQVQYEYNYCKDQQYGLCKCYYEDGQVKYEWNYLNMEG